MDQISAIVIEEEEFVRCLFRWSWRSLDGHDDAEEWLMAALMIPLVSIIMPDDDLPLKESIGIEPRPSWRSKVFTPKIVERRCGLLITTQRFSLPQAWGGGDGGGLVCCWVLRGLSPLRRRRSD